MARNTRAAAQLTFHKYQGLGNNFILVDNRSSPDLLVDSERAKTWCNPYFGIGADGVIFALPPQDGMDLSMRLYNSDGSEPEMCGNGIRCLAKFVADMDGASPGKYRVHTGAGEIVPEILSDGRVRVDMGQPLLQAKDVPTSLAEGTQQAVGVPVTVGANDYSITAVGMGNPHAVIYERNSVLYNVDEIDLSTIGPQFEKHPTFPAGTNTEFVQVMSRSYVKMVVWERGAGRTLACGTGACATVVAGVLEGKVDRSCTVELPGGPLDIEWDEASNHVFMTGPAERVYVGQADI